MLIPVLAALLVTAPDSSRWIVSNHGREAGDLVVTTRGDSITARWIFTDRQRGTRLETRYRVGAEGQFVSGESRPVLADGAAGEATERFTVLGDSVRVSGSGRERILKREPGSWLALQAETPWAFARQVKTLLATKDRRGRLPDGTALRVEVVADTVLRRGTTRQRARFVVLTTGTRNNTPGVWVDETGALLATDVAWFITVRPDLVPLLPSLRAIELRWRTAEAERVAKTLVTPHSGTLVFRNGNVFDAEQGVMVPQQTVVVRGDRIVAMGPASSTAAPAGATVIDATGKTIMPGMWEMHAHAQVGTQGALGITQLAQGLTTARDMASDIDVAVSLRDRERAGRLATPRYVLAGFIEGPLKWAGPTATIVSTEVEARAWVARYDSLGYRQVKLYNAVHPDLVPTIAAEARKRGMRVSGHIPRGMSIEAAVGLGYDEIQHAAFLFSNFFPDSLFLPQMRAYSNVATAVAPTFDVNGAPMTRLIDFLKAHNTVIDGTFNLWIGGGSSVVGAGGSTNQQRADSAYMQLIRRLHTAGVPLVAGTDDPSSVTYRRELEMYELAGIPRAKILQIATIDAARIMKDDREYGSLTVGKVADLLVVNGDPTRQISELTKLETVVRGGRLYQIEALRKAGVGGAQGMGAADGHGPHWH